MELPNFTTAEFLLNKLHSSFPWGKQSELNSESDTQKHAILPLEITFANPRLATRYHAAEQAISPKKLFIGGIAPAATEQDVRSLLNPFGRIESLTLIIRGGGCNRNCAFVQFSTWASCEAAIQALHSKFTMAGTDAPLIVKFADAQRIDSTHKMNMYRSKQSGITPLAAANVYGGVYYSNVYGGGMGGTSYMHQYPTPPPYGMPILMSSPNTGGDMSGYNGYHGQQMMMPSSSAYPNHQGHPHVRLGGDGVGYPTNNGNAGNNGGYFSHNNNFYSHQRRYSGGETQYYNNNGFKGRHPRGHPGGSNISSRQGNNNPGKINVGSSSVRSRSSGSASIEAKLTATRLTSSETLTTDDEVPVLPGETSSKTETASISCSDDKSPKSKSHGTVAEEVVVYFNGGGKSDGSDEGSGHPPEFPRHSARENNGDDEGEEKMEEEDREGSEMHEHNDDVGNPSHTTTPTSAAALVAAAAMNENAHSSKEHIVINNSSNQYNSNSRGRGRQYPGRRINRKNTFHHHYSHDHLYNYQYDHIHQQAAAYYNNSYHQNPQPYYYAQDVVGEYYHYQQTSASPPAATYTDGTAEYPMTTTAAAAVAVAGHIPPSPLPERMYYGSKDSMGGGIPTMPVTDAIAVPNTAVPICTAPLPYSPISVANGGVGWVVSQQVLDPLGTSMGHTSSAAAPHLFYSPQRKGNGKMGKGVKDVALYAHKLFIGQLSFDTIEEELYEWFACFGEILELAVLRLHGESQGCAFLTYSRKEHALAAKDAMNGKPVGKLRKRIVVKFADVDKAMGGEEGEGVECDDEQYEKKI